MKLSFELNGTHYEGTAVAFERPDSLDTQFVIRLQDQPVFHLQLSEEGEWTSDDTDNKELVCVIGEQIEKGDTDDIEIVSNGEIINEPDDVTEQSGQI